MLDIWPAFPLVVRGNRGRLDRTSGADEINSALKHSSRICKIIFFSSSEQANMAIMQEPFPELTDLDLKSSGKEPVVPDSFLGQSAPRLRKLDLDAVPYPGLPKLLLSASHLVTLRLWNIPHSGYFPPEAMVTCLSTLTSLEILILQFRYPYFLPDRESRRPPPPTRSILPALTGL